MPSREHIQPANQISTLVFENGGEPLAHVLTVHSSPKKSRQTSSVGAVCPEREQSEANTKRCRTTVRQDKTQQKAHRSRPLPLLLSLLLELSLSHAASACRRHLLLLPPRQPRRMMVPQPQRRHWHPLHKHITQSRSIPRPVLEPGRAMCQVDWKPSVKKLES